MRLVKWEFNQVQDVLDAVAEKQMAEMGRVRVIVPKRRRGGVSTYVQGRFYNKCSLNPLVEAFTIAHEAKSTWKIFAITRLMQDENPLSPPTNYSTRIELAFKNRSNQGLATAGSPESSRSGDVTLFHWSEVAFSPGAEKIVTSTMACLPDPPAYSEAWFESSGNGFGNLFQKLCHETYCEGKYPYLTHNGYTYAYSNPATDWVLVFFPWFCLPDASKSFPNTQAREDFERVLEVPVYRKDLGRSGPKAELEMRDKWNLSAEQLNWRRWKIESEYRGSEDSFRQEYPTTLNDCFLTTGGHVFSPDLCDSMESQCKDPIMDATLSERQGKVVARRMANGPLRIWESPIKGADYLISCDPAGGDRPHQSDRNAPDYTAMDVWRREGSYLIQVAQWHGRPDYDVIGDEAILLARLYGKASIAVLRLMHGFAVLTVLAREEYPNVVKDDDGNPGILENANRKRVMVDFAVGSARDGQVAVMSRETVAEMRTFVDRNRKTGAEDGCKDDRVASLYCGVYSHTLLPSKPRLGESRGRAKPRFTNLRNMNSSPRKPRSTGPRIIRA